MSDEMEDKEREAFEKWNGPHFLSRCNAPRENPKEYQNPVTNCKWKGWIARAANVDPRPAP